MSRVIHGISDSVFSPIGVNFFAVKGSKEMFHKIKLKGPSHHN
jgi:hypothetical protein